MKGVAFTIAMLLLAIPLVSSAESPENNTSFAIDTSGYGYSFPPGLVFIIGPQIVTWSYEDGVTKSIIPPFYINGSQRGVAIAFFGVWSAPGLLAQPGNISGMLVGIIFMVPK